MSEITALIFALVLTAVICCMIRKQCKNELKYAPTRDETVDVIDDISIHVIEDHSSRENYDPPAYNEINK